MFLKKIRVPLDIEMILSETGIIVDTMWHEIKNHAPNIETDVFVVMPNHIHGIVILNHNHNNMGTLQVGPLSVETLHATFLQTIPAFIYKFILFLKIRFYLCL